MDRDTMYQAGSISKPFFAAAVMRLAQEKKIDLNRDIREYGKYDFYETYDKKEHKVTLRQLLSHTAGFDLHGFAGYGVKQEIPTLDQILKGEDPANNFPLKMIYEPGTRWSYSGGGYLLAQKIISDVQRSDIEQIITESVLKPLGLENSTYKNPVKGDQSNYASGHDIHNKSIEGGFCRMPETAAAGLWTTPTDLVRFGQELMKACNGQSDVFTRETIQEMITRTTPDGQTGCGLCIPMEENVKQYFDHGGDNIGYHSLMCFQATTESGYAVMINSDIGRDIIGEVDGPLSNALHM